MFTVNFPIVCPNCNSSGYYKFNQVRQEQHFLFECICCNRKCRLTTEVEITNIEEIEEESV